MKIIVTLRSLTKLTRLELDEEKQTANLNGTPIDINVEPFINKLLKIVSSWKKRMVNDFILDGLEYTVKIEKDDKSFEFYGRNKFPDNFQDFINLLQSENIN